MAEDKITLPSSGGGIIRYFEDFKSKIELKPEVIIVVIGLVVVLEIILHVYGNSIFGIA